MTAAWDDVLGTEIPGAGGNGLANGDRRLRDSLLLDLGPTCALDRPATPAPIQSSLFAAFATAVHRRARDVALDDSSSMRGTLAAAGSPPDGARGA
jgi:hypothetical protein